MEFAILTNEIMQGTFDLKVDEYKQVKSLARENLRDHMTDIELILTMLGEATTTKLHRDRDSEGIAPLKKKTLKMAARWQVEHARILSSRAASR